MAFRIARTFGDNVSEEERAFARLATPISKYFICKRAPAVAYEAMECHGGNGLWMTPVCNFPLPFSPSVRLITVPLPPSPQDTLRTRSCHASTGSRRSTPSGRAPATSSASTSSAPWPRNRGRSWAAAASTRSQVSADDIFFFFTQIGRGIHVGGAAGQGHGQPVRVSLHTDTHFQLLTPLPSSLQP